MGSQAYENVHIILFPFMAQGHMIPMIDIARLLASRGATITIVTTVNNALRFKQVLSRASESGLKLNIIHLELPGKEESGIPEGCDNVDSLPSTALIDNFHKALSALQSPAEKLLRENIASPRPNCLISDMFLPWTIHIARSLGVPRISFHGTSSFVLFCVDMLHATKIQESVGSESEYFVIPGPRDRIEATRGQIPENRHNTNNPFMMNQVFDAEEASYGTIVNTFEELEPEYAEGFKSLRDGKVWCLGPASLCNKEHSDMAQRGNSESALDERECLEWLGSWERGSVVYVCLGSLCNLRAPQLVELGLGLEASNKPFVWVIRGKSSESEELEKWISGDGFEERIGRRGLLVRGWAPQVVILSHPSVGGFLTHCGWNSTLEGISAGVPLITWPLFGDQFLNEKLAAQVLKIAVTLGVEEPMRWGEEEKVGVMVKRETIKSALERLLDEGNEESRERRGRARKLRYMAKRAVEEGGSSHNNITLFLDEIVKLGKACEQIIGEYQN